MTKKDSINTRYQMLKVSFENNTKKQTRGLLEQWNVRDLYDILELVTITDHLDIKEEALTIPQVKLVVDVYSEKCNEHCAHIWMQVGKIIAMLDKPESYENEIGDWVRWIEKMRKQLPKDAHKEIQDQDPRWKEFFKKEWPAIRKKYIGK